MRPFRAMGTGAKFLVLLVGTVAGAVLTWHRRRQSQKTLAAISEGRMCLHCDGFNVTPDGKGGIGCNECGQHTSAALIRAGFDAEELDAIIRMD